MTSRSHYGGAGYLLATDVLRRVSKEQRVHLLWPVNSDSRLVSKTQHWRVGYSLRSLFLQNASQKQQAATDAFCMLKKKHMQADGTVCDAGAPPSG